MKKIKFFLSLMLSLVALAASAQNVTVKGTVTDAATGDGIPACAIQVKGTTQGTVADVDGAYTISAPVNSTLVYTFIGYKTVEARVNGAGVMNIALSADAQMLDETIVVAFGTTTKEAFTGSASVVNSEQLAKRQTTDVTNALVGSVAGFQMRGAGGQPGSSSGSISIRGLSSLYADTEPLIIVDGAPYSASISNIPQNDIESISVLKDAASAALYGARGASGVIIITTKKGKASNATVNVDVKVGANTKAVQDYDIIRNPGEYYEAYYKQVYNYNYYGKGLSAAEANLAANKTMLSDLAYQTYTVPQGETLIGLDGKLNPKATPGYKHNYNGEDYWIQGDDWNKMAYKNALRQEYNISLNGSTDKASYYTSLSYLDEDGIVAYSGYKRVAARVKADYQAKKWLKVGANIGFTNSNQTANPNMDTSMGSTNLMHYTTFIAPIYPVYVRVVDGDGNVSIRKDANGNDQYDYGVAATNYGITRPFLATGNPFGSNRYNVVKTTGYQLNGTFTADVNFAPWLKLSVSSNVVLGQSNSTKYDNALYGPKVGVKGELTKQGVTSLRTNNIQTLTFAKAYGAHDINVLVGHEYYYTRSNSLVAVGQGLFSPEILELGAAAKKLDSTTSTSSAYNVEGFFASAQYNYDYKYYLSASYRIDGSSRFSEKKRWGNFWSVGGAWIISKEDFMSNADAVDMLKFKASVGQQGNDGIGNWAYVDLYSIKPSGEFTMSPTFARLGNKDITWETTTNFNTGVEFSFFKGRLTGGVDAYYKKTRDLLFWLSVPESSGTRGYYGNMGNICNYGVELTLSADVIRTRNFVWNIAGNLASNKGKILKLPETKLSGRDGFTENGLWFKEGGDMNNYFTYMYAGVNEHGEAVYYYDEDLSNMNPANSSNKIDVPGKKFSGTTTSIEKASKYEQGSTMPKVFGGFATSFQFYGVDISATFDYQIGGKVYDSRYAAYMSPTESVNSAGWNFHKDYLNSWTPSNASSNVPRWQYLDQYTTAASSRFLTDASYLNFQSFTVGYTLPEKLTSKIKIQRIRFYCAGENLWFWSARQGLDPRYSFTGNTSVATYSPVRTISGGVQLTF
ncbi:MAG: SusC/RagA family TonB-linked outer membrane protein [Bacteroidales bacterium]|nr:SusC/RagA family TonB-linked outer membrane protein [Bacteroidales bacterium]